MRGQKAFSRSMVEGLEGSSVRPRISGGMETFLRLSHGLCLGDERETIELRVPREGTGRKEREGDCRGL
jgi:hypothetical protein